MKLHWILDINATANLKKKNEYLHELERAAISGYMQSQKFL